MTNSNTCSLTIVLVDQMIHIRGFVTFTIFFPIFNMLTQLKDNEQNIF